MKNFFQTLFVLSAVLLGTASGESQFTKEQVSEMGRLILAVPENREYKEIFWDGQPEYDAKTNLWVYMNGFPRTPGGTAYIFQIRAADRFYRPAWTTQGKSSQGYERFRIQPAIRSKLTGLIKSFRKP